MAQDFYSLPEMLERVSSRSVMMDLFEAFAPKERKAIDWSKLCTSPAQRANLLAQRMGELSNTNQREYESLVRHLTTIASINSTVGNSNLIQTMIGKSVPLQNAFAGYNFELSHDAYTTGNLAGWICFMSKRTNDVAGERAKVIWDTLVAGESAKKKGIVYKTYNILPATKRGEDRVKGMHEFEAEYEESLKEQMPGTNFLVAVLPIEMRDHVRYVIEISQPPHEKSNPDFIARRFISELDRSAIGFVIRYYHARNYVMISHPPNSSPRSMAGKFIKSVLGSDFEPKENLRFTRPLRLFKTRNWDRVVKLPPENTANGESVWVESIDFTRKERFQAKPSIDLDGKNGLAPTLALGFPSCRFYGCEGGNIFDMIESLPNKHDLPLELWEINEVVVAFRLRDYLYDEDTGGKIGPKSTFHTYRVSIKPDAFKIIQLNKIADQHHLDFILKCRHDWGFAGETAEAEGLSIQEEEISHGPDHENHLPGI